MYVNSAHTPKNTAPATHITNNTTGTGNSRNHSKASPIPVDTGGAAGLGCVLDFVVVVGCLVRKPHTSSLAELLLRGVRASRQVVGWVAGPSLGGRQVAVSSSYASSFTSRVTTASYYRTKGMYVPHDTKLVPELRRIPILGTSVNKG
jgi:hypothetical protein